MPAFLTPANVAPGTTGSWQAVDLSGSVPVGVTGVILHVVCTAGNLAFGARKNGSSDNRTGVILSGYHCWIAVGVDASRVLELYIASADLDVYLVGYFGVEATFNTNGVDKSLSATAAWTDINCSANAPNATGLLFEVSGTSSDYAVGLRKNGSTDARTGMSYEHIPFSGFIGCDASQVCEGYIGNASVDFFLLGYTTAQHTWNTNGTDASLGSTGSYQDLSALPAGAQSGIYNNHDAVFPNKFAFRKNGTAEDLYYRPRYDGWAWVECDASRIVEGKIETTNMDFFVVGYSAGITYPNNAPTAPTALLCEEGTNPTGITDTTPEFSAILNDPDAGDILTHVQILVNTTEAFDGVSMWDSGWVDIVDVTAGNRCADVSYAGTALSENGMTFYWKLRAKDDDAEIGPYSAVASFRMAVPNKSLTEAVSVSDSVLRVFGITRSEAFPMAATMGNLSLLVSFPEIAALSSSAGFVLDVVRNYLEELALSAAASEHAVQVLQENAALAEAIGRAIVKTMQGEALDLADAVNFATVRELVEELSLSEQSALFRSLLSFYESAGLSDAPVARALAKALAEAMPLAEALVRLHAKALTEGMALDADASLLISINRILGETLDLADTQTSAMVLALVEALATADSRSMLVAKVLAEGLVADDSQRVAFVRALSESLALSGDVGLALEIVRAFVESLAADEVLLRALSVGNEENLALAEDRLTSLLKMLPETLVVSDEATKGIVRALVEALSCDDAVRKAILRQVVESLDLVDSKTASVAKFLSEALSLDEVRSTALAVRLSELLALDEATLTALALTRAETLAIDETMVASLGATLAETLGLSDTAAKAVARAFVEAITAADTSANAVAKTLPETLELIESAAEAIALLRAEGMSLADVYSAIFGRVFPEQADLSENMTRALAASRLLAELAGMGDRLRIGGVWTDPQVKIITSILKATLTAGVTRAEVETSITKAAIQAEVR
jgi:hypothetical protein